MTKKAEKMVTTYKERLEINANYFITNAVAFNEETGKLDKEYDFTKGFLKDIQKYFVDMIRGMYRFNMISEKDFNELYEKAHELQREVFEKMLNAYIEAKY